MDVVQVASLSKGMRIEAESHQPKLGAVVGVVTSIRDRSPEDPKEIRVAIKPDGGEEVWVKPEWIKRVVVGEAKVYAEPDKARETKVTNTSEQMNKNPMLGLLGAMDDQSRGRRQGSFIEDMEKRGQQELVNQTSKLPTEGSKDPAWAKMGVIYGEPVAGDPMFRNVELPHGWKLKATDHDMWNDLLDDKGRLRAKMFYKAAFYDRSCNIRPEKRFGVDREYEKKGDYDSPRRTIVKDHGTGTTLHIVSAFKPYDPKNYEDEGKDYKIAEKWLYEHRPLWQDASAYWGWD